MTPASRKQPSRVWRWRRSVANSSLPATTRAVLRALTEFMDSDGGSCFPSQREVAAAAGLCENTVSGHLARAEKAGWVRSGPGPYGGQIWKRKSYIACFPDETQISTDNCMKEAAMTPPVTPEGPPADGDKVPQEMGQDKTSPDTSPNTGVRPREPEAIDPRKIEAAFWAWLRTYPRPPEKTPKRALAIWMRMQGVQRQACIELTSAYLRTVKDKSRHCGPETYLRERRWERIAKTASDYRPEHVEAKFGGLAWMAWYLWLLSQPPSGVIKITATEETMIAAGRLDRDELIREKLRNFGWPAALRMLEKRGKQTFWAPYVASVLAENLVWVGHGSPLFQAWNGLFEQRGWPMPVSFGDGLYFPAVDDLSGDLAAQVEGAVAAYERMAKDTVNGR